MIAVSGGFSIITDRLRGELGLDKVFCNELVFENGLLVGLKINVTSDKAASVLPTIRNWGINKSEIVVVVDGANDLNLFDIAGYTVGFCPVEKVREKSDAVLEIRNLSLLLNLLEKRFGNAVLASTP
jgi:phosphoserine phosphatase